MSDKQPQFGFTLSQLFEAFLDWRLYAIICAALLVTLGVRQIARYAGAHLFAGGLQFFCIGAVQLGTPLCWLALLQSAVQV